MRLRHLAMTLSKLPAHPFREPALEQYGTDGETAARWLFSINSEEPFEETDGVIDLGAGNGILGIGALLLGAPNAIFVEIDPEVCISLQKAISSMNLDDKCRILNGDVRSIVEEQLTRDLVIMNPPWGRQTPRADRPFLDAAIKCATESIHLLHGRGAKHIEPWAEAAGWKAKRWMEVDLPMPAIYPHHTKRRDSTEAAMWWIKRPAR
ncbi:MAG TPA: RsmD family RNA methyltransferase [Candidatus Thalassarchaeaceae archaeon]|nr:RsmD family RNA methyltransferase [Candidatus Thalassarchaeaceae archaeon]